MDYEAKYFVHKNKKKIRELMKEIQEKERSKKLEEEFMKLAKGKIKVKNKDI